MAKSLKDQGNKLKSLLSSAVESIKYTTAIHFQGSCALVEFPCLPAHMKKAKGHAGTWTREIWEEIQKMSKEILGYADTFINASNKLVELLPSLMKGDETAKEEFLHILNVILIGALKNLRVVLESVTDGFSKFQESFLVDITDFKTGAMKAQMTFESKQQQLTNLNCDLDETRKSVSSLERAMLEEYSGIYYLYGIAFMLLTNDDKNYSAVPLVVTAISVSSASCEKSHLVFEYAQELKKEHEVQRKLYAANNNMLALQFVMIQILSFSNAVSDIVVHAQSLQNGWQIIQDELEDLAQAVTDVSSLKCADIIMENIKASMLEWEDMRAQIQKMLPPGCQIHTKKVKDFNEFIHAIENEC